MPFPKLGAYIFFLCFLCGVGAFAQYSQEELLAESDALFDRGAYADAMKGYAQLLSLDPTNPIYSYRYGATALYGDPSKKEEAIKYLRFASKKPGMEPLVWYFMGRAYHLNYQFADAIEAYEKYRESAPRKEAEQWQIDQVIRTAINGQDLLSQIKDVTVIDKKKTTSAEFFRLYDLDDIGGRILVTPDELLTSLDEKMGHQSLIHFRGDGTTVYFSSYGKDGKNGLDIYAADVLPGGTFSAPKRLPETVNTPYDEDFPYMHPDGRTLYFSSKGHTSMGGYDIFKSAYDRASGAFGSPENMDFAVNTPDDDIFYIADSLNRRANFASGRNSRQGELHVYRVEVDMQPVELTLIKGTFANQMNPSQLTAKITVIDAATNTRKEVQYTDPATGDYLLSFPKSGKYKLLIEAQGSNQVHSGIVQVPASDGLQAYLQEMELTIPGGFEKLIIHNLFDQTYDGDVAALAREMLRKRAALEVNFDATAPEIEAEVSDEEPVAMDVSSAYNAAGFGAGLSNEKVLENAEQRLSTTQAQIEELRGHAVAAAAESEVALNEAADFLTEVDALSKASTEVRDEGEVAFETALLKWRAAQATERARVAQELRSTLDAKSNELERQLEVETTEVTDLREAIDSGDFNKALEALKSENDRIKARSVLDEKADMLQQIGKMNSAAQEELQRFRARAVSLRNETDALVGRRVTKRRQLSNAKGKTAKQYEEELARLELEIEDMEAAASRAFAQVEDKENRANQLREQLNMLEGIVAGDISGGDEFIPKGSAVTAARIDAMEADIQSMGVDDQLVQSYLSSHPQALASVGSQEALRDFQKTTGISIEAPEETWASLQEKTTDEGVPEEMDPDESHLAQASERTPLNEAGSQQDPDSSIENIQPLDDPTLLAQRNLNIDQDERETTVVVPADSNPQDAASSADDVSNDMDTDSVEELQVSLATASDWIEIIDDSVDELRNRDGAPNAEVEAQLLEFEALRAEKLEEIAVYEERLAALEGAEVNEPADAKSPESTLNQLETPVVLKEDTDQKEPVVAPLPSRARVEEAVAEINKLDPALVSRLESKINEASSSPSFVEHISLVSPEYIPDLEKVEMSGMSPAEMAAERIAINESLITEILIFEEELQEESTVRERLVELRRIKALEIIEDREVMAGSIAFAPRTSEAMSYQKMLVDEDKDTSQSGSSSASIEQRTIWSPAIEASLKKPYSWDDILPGYLDMIEEDVNVDTDVAALQKRMDSHETVIAHLVDEIEIYRLLTNDPKAASDIRVKQRFDQLQMEKETVEELMSSDGAILAEVQQREAADQSAFSSSQGPEGSELEEVGDTESAHLTAAQKEETQVPDYGTHKAYIEEVLQRMEKAYTAFADAPEKDSGGLEKLAELNKAEADGINDRIGSLTQTLDATMSDSARDAIQIQIQELDNLLADRLQEADRLSAEAEALRASRLDLTEEPDTDSADMATADLPGDLLELEDLQLTSSLAIKLDDFQYRSLEANMSGSKLDEKANKSKALREEAEAMAIAYKKANTPAERKKIYGEYELLAKQIKRSDMEFNSAIRKANEAETGFYMKSAQVRLEDLRQKLTDEDNKEAMNRVELRLNGIERDLDVNRQLWDEIDVHDTGAYSEMLEMEMALIQELDLLSSELENIQSRTPDLADQTDLSADVDEEYSDAEDLLNQEKPLAGKVSEANEDAASVRAQESHLVAIEPLDPIAHTPLMGRKYTTPALKEAAEMTTPLERDGFAARNPVLDVELASLWLDRGSSVEAFRSHPQLKGADPEVLDAVLSTPAEKEFLALLITADTLKILEKAHEEELDTYYSKARESSAESMRLIEALPLETNPQNRIFIQERAQRLEEQSLNAYKRAAYAAQRADAIRNMRKTHNEHLAKSASSLEPSQKERVEGLLTMPSYTIVLSDLASMDDPNMQDTKGGREPAPGRTSIETAPAIVTEPEDTIAPDTSFELADPTVSPSEGSPESAPGYWLSLVEVIAEKDDFSDVSGNMFVVADKEVYGASKPIPIDPEMPSGLIFQVQIGAFRNPIPQSLFGAIAPIMGQKLENGITRYRAGLFKSYSKAIEARDEVRGMGYGDAFVVAYVDGERLSPEQARSMVAQAQALLAAEDAGVSDRKDRPTPAPIEDGATAINENAEAPALSYYDDPEAAEAVQVEVVRGLFYTVQVGVYSKPVKLAQLYNLNELNSELTSGGLIRYTTGRYTSAGAASEGKVKAVNAGVSDAFVTAYFNGSRITLGEAEAILEREGEEILNLRMGAAAGPQSEAAFVVVVSQFTGDVPAEVAEVLLTLDNISLQLVEGDAEERYYISQKFDSREGAERLLIQLRNAGLGDAYLATLEGDSMQPLR